MQQDIAGMATLHLTHHMQLMEKILAIHIYKWMKYGGRGEICCMESMYQNMYAIQPMPLCTSGTCENYIPFLLYHLSYGSYIKGTINKQINKYITCYNMNIQFKEINSS
jgi:hypothetical protein